MRIVFNTNYKSAGTRVCVDDLSRFFVQDGHEVVHNDWESYEKYDIALFMAPDSQVCDAKKRNSRIVCGIMDPKVGKSRYEAEIKAADFLAVSSVEQYDFFLRFNKNVFVYYMFPDVEPRMKNHEDKKPVIIGYHGNKQHLDSMKKLSCALDRLSDEMQIEFHAIYNIKKLGPWKWNLPKRCKTVHIQWDEASFMDNVASFDIGVMPTNLPLPWYAQIVSRPLRSFVYNPEGFYNHNYIMRYKYSNNPGRLYPFAMAGIPVVAEMSPSTAQFIVHGENGFLASSVEGWYRNLNLLAQSTERRGIVADAMRIEIEKQYRSQDIYKKFVGFLQKIKYSP